MEVGWSKSHIHNIAFEERLICQTWLSTETLELEQCLKRVCGRLRDGWQSVVSRETTNS